MTDTQSELRSRVYKTVCAHRNSTTPDQFTDMLMKLLPSDGWRDDMENAPRDGTEILAIKAGNRAGLSCVIYWDEDHSEWAGRTHDDELKLVKQQPTHWRPLPQPPVPSETTND